LSAHRLIFEAISARDAEEARQLMDEHLEITGQISDDAV
jgi:DNA-binding FadR family transcriptional regulator